jgi:hypothetical protein
MNELSQRSIPPLLGSARPARPAGLIIGACLASFAAVVLFLFNPAQTSIYPVCQFKAWTGLDCPGCGSLRALHQLLHGNLLVAFRFNALLVSALPFAAWFGVRAVLNAINGRPTFPRIRPVWLWSVCALLFAFGIVRNLHLSWLSWMAS